MKFLTKKTIRYFIGLSIIFYLSSLAFLYYNQEKFFFNPKILESTYNYTFEGDFEEYNIKVDAKNTLNTLLFKCNSPKGVVLYLHGNAGALHDWGLRAPLYTQNNHDVLFVDYRGYGKNKNTIENEVMLHQDMQVVYNFLKTKYDEKDITILGFSIGSGLAAKLAANNKPKQLILEAPYYSFESLINRIVPIVPRFLINYKIKTHLFLKDVHCPITIFHGKNDQLISPKHNAIPLSKIKPNSTLHLIENCNHNGIYRSDFYSNKLQELLD